MRVLLPKTIATWFAILACAVLNGALRDLVLAPRVGRAIALPLSGVLLSAVVVAVTWLAAPWFGRLPVSRHAGIGALWLALTLGFESGFGRLVQHRSWPDLLAAYTFEGGNLWPLVLLVTAAAPLLVARWRGLVAG